MILSTTEQIKTYTDKGWWGNDTLIDLFHRHVADYADEIALVDPPNKAELVDGHPQRLTYADLKMYTDRLAAALLENGVGKDDLVVVQLPNIVELIVVYLAVARIGAILSPVPVQYRRYELSQVFNLAKPKIYITTNNFQNFDYIELFQQMQADHSSIERVIALGSDLPADVLSLGDILMTDRGTSTIDDHLVANPFTANDIYTVCWTSGTEADPKGVPRSHNLWIAIAWATVDGAQLDFGCNLLNPFPMVNMSGIGGMLVPWLLTGGKLVMHHPLNLPVFLQQMGVEKINYTVAPPVLLTLLLIRPGLLEQADLSHIKNIGSGSAPLSPWMVEQWQEQHNIPVLNFFGSNEGMALVGDPVDIPDPAERARMFPRWGIGGTTWSNRVATMNETKLVDPDTKEVITEAGKPGELAFRGATVFPGYYKRPDLTEKAFDEDGFFYTGDLFMIDGTDGADDRYRSMGRLKDVINRGGVNISPEEIEYLLAQHPALEDVAVVGVPGGQLEEETVCAVVVFKAEQEATLDDLVEFLNEKEIAAYKLPRKMVVFDALPRNAVGKILKREIRKRLLEGDSEAKLVPA